MIDEQTYDATVAEMVQLGMLPDARGVRKCRVKSPADRIDQVMESLPALARFAAMKKNFVDEPDPAMWNGRIPMGHVTLLAGPPGVGKSLLVLDLAARLSRAAEWPGGGKFLKPIRSILLMEEDFQWTIQRRLAACGADLERVMRLSRIHRGDREVYPDLFHHTDALRKAMRKFKDLGLVIIDPLPAFTGERNLGHGVHARRLIEELRCMVARRGAAVIAVTHLNKMPSGKGLDRALGSIALAAAARSVHFVLPDPTDPQRRLFVPVKQNLTAPTPGLAFRIESDPEGRPRIAWEADPLPDRVEEILSAHGVDRASPSVDHACDFLMRELRGGPRIVAELVDAGRRRGISYATLQRAKRAMCIRAIRHGFGAGARYEWQLPPELQTPQIHNAEPDNSHGVSPRK